MATDPAKKERNAEEAYRASLTRVMGTPDGRRIIWRALERAGIFRSTFCGDETHRAAMLEGRRSIGLELLAEIQDWCPDLYQTMQTEQRREDPDG